MLDSNEWTVLCQKAKETVEQQRKGEARIRFATIEGKPIQGLEVQVTQKTQDFLFGNLVFDLARNDPPYQPDLFRLRFLELFNLADWVEKSFRWAYAANPRATLIINDYDQEFDPKVRQRFFDLIRELQRREVPVSGIGLQMHPVNHWLWPHEIWDTLQMYAELDSPIHITELHQPSCDQEIEGGWREGKWTLEAQSEFLEQVYRQCFGHPSVVSINYWGLSDRNIWIPGAGLTDAEYRPKPVFSMLKNLIRGEWMTAPFMARTDENGEILFRGFYGRYEITQCLPERRFPSWDFHLAEKQENVWTFRP